MTNRPSENYETLDSHGIPIRGGTIALYIGLLLFLYSLFAANIDQFVQFGGVIGAVYWPITTYLILVTFKHAKGPWTFRQKFMFWNIIIFSPFFAFIAGLFWFGVFYPAWSILAWIYKNSTSSSTWFTFVVVAITLIIGAVLFFFRLHARATYGITEVVAGVLVVAYRSHYSANLDASFFLFILTAGVYLVVRGLDNIHTGAFKEPRDCIYSWILSRRDRIDRP
jgi:hypothetical protein